jgi:glutamate-1-semialdehyde 2,1-aminomutase
MPVGAVAGKRSLMELLAPLGKIYQAGTLSGNPVALAAGIATLGELKDSGIYGRLEMLGAAFDAELAPFAQEDPWFRWRRLGSMLWFHLAEGPIPRRADQIHPEAILRFKKIFLPLLHQGFYLPPSAYEIFFLCAAHTEEEVRGLARTAAELVRR